MTMQQYLCAVCGHIHDEAVDGVFEDLDKYHNCPECGCGNDPSLEDLCRNPLDNQFALPGHLEKQVLELTSQKLLGTYFQVKTDMTDDGVDGQAPNAPAGK
jgi:rubredoxin